MFRASQSAKSAVNRAQQFQKYTVQPTGIGAWINRILAVDSKRSTGVPLNPQFRNPPPAANDPMDYDDPVTLPAGDIAENPYWKRDNRRRYPALSQVTQADAVALLSVGSKAKPNEEVLQIGEAGKKQLVEVKEQGSQGGIAVFLAGEKGLAAAKSVLGEGGLPPKPPQTVGAKTYTLMEEQSYEGAYPCRCFN